MQYYIKFDSQGNRLTSCVEGVHFQLIGGEPVPPLPEGFVPVSLEEQKLYASGLYFRDPETKLPVKKRPRERSLEEFKVQKIETIRAEADEGLRRMRTDYSEAEIISWPRQESGARLLAQDSAAVSDEADFVRALARGRGLPVEILVEKIMLRLSGYGVAMASILGRQQRREDLVRRASSPEELASV